MYEEEGLVGLYLKEWGLSAVVIAGGRYRGDSLCLPALISTIHELTIKRYSKLKYLPPHRRLQIMWFVGHHLKLCITVAYIFT